VNPKFSHEAESTSILRCISATFPVFSAQSKPVNVDLGVGLNASYTGEIDLFDT